jgi:hypothetical protein
MKNLNQGENHEKEIIMSFTKNDIKGLKAKMNSLKSKLNKVTKSNLKVLKNFDEIIDTPTDKYLSIRKTINDHYSKLLTVNPNLIRFNFDKVRLLSDLYVNKLFVGANSNLLDSLGSRNLSSITNSVIENKEYEPSSSKEQLLFKVISDLKDVTLYDLRNFFETSIFEFESLPQRKNPRNKVMDHINEPCENDALRYLYSIGVIEGDYKVNQTFSKLSWCINYNNYTINKKLPSEWRKMIKRSLFTLNKVYGDPFTGFIKAMQSDCLISRGKYEPEIFPSDYFKSYGNYYDDDSYVYLVNDIFFFMPEERKNYMNSEYRYYREIPKESIIVYMTLTNMTFPEIEKDYFPIPEQKIQEEEDLDPYRNMTENEINECKYLQRTAEILYNDLIEGGRNIDEEYVPKRELLFEEIVEDDNPDESNFFDLFKEFDEDDPGNLNEGTDIQVPNDFFSEEGTDHYDSKTLESNDKFETG